MTLINWLWNEHNAALHSTMNARLLWNNFLCLRWKFPVQLLDEMKTRCTRKTREGKSETIEIEEKFFVFNHFNLARLFLFVCHNFLWITDLPSSELGFTIYQISFFYCALLQHLRSRLHDDLNIFSLLMNTDVSSRLQKKAQFINRYLLFLFASN